MSSRAARRGRSRHLERQAGDHQRLPEDHQAGALTAAPAGTSRRFLPEELELYFDDIVDATERIWDLLDNYKEVVEALESTNEAVINHRQRRHPADSDRVLGNPAPADLITGFFGMNLDFPGFNSAWAFSVVFGVMASVLVGMLAFFRLKRWL